MVPTALTGDIDAQAGETNRVLLGVIAAKGVPVLSERLLGPLPGLPTR